MNGHLNILQLVLHASIPVLLVLALLVVFSFVSWVIMLRKFSTLRRAHAEAEDFEERFWSGGDLTNLYRHVEHEGQDASGLAAIFRAGFKEFVDERKRGGTVAASVMQRVERAMGITGSRQLSGMGEHLQFLANVGSISPYIGLFGTVWGIMAAFQGLSEVQEATIAMVAPGISEALVATAMGLFAAIPAVWAYNRATDSLERLGDRYDHFQDEFSAILEHQSNAQTVE